LKSLRKALLAILIVSSLGLGASQEDRYKELADKFICLCGCNMGTLNMCVMIQCGHAVPMRAELKQMVDSGMTDEAITAAFVQKYGNGVLSSPPMSGFNLSAWVMPFAALAFGLLVVIYVVRTWKSRTPEAQTAGPIDAKYHSQIEEELKNFTPED
jgi:cytochrome c-type biogenesis protein CcmH/NrfF